MEEKINIKLKYWLNDKLVEIKNINVNEIDFKILIADMLIDLPFQLYIFNNDYWDFSTLKSYDKDMHILTLKGVNSNIMIEVLKA